MPHCPIPSAVPAILGDCLLLNVNDQPRHDVKFEWLDNAFFKISAHETKDRPTPTLAKILQKRLEIALSLLNTIDYSFVSAIVQTFFPFKLHKKSAISCWNFLGVLYPPGIYATPVSIIRFHYPCLKHSLTANWRQKSQAAIGKQAGQRRDSRDVGEMYKTG